MHRTIAALGLGCLLLAGCASGPETESTAARREEGYVPTGSNIPRKDPKRSDIPAASNSQIESLTRGSMGPRSN
jgi:hypothetical protein